jgi:hypothetical protein
VPREAFCFFLNVWLLCFGSCVWVFVWCAMRARKAHVLLYSREHTTHITTRTHEHNFAAAAVGRRRVVSITAAANAAATAAALALAARFGRLDRFKSEALLLLRLGARGAADAHLDGHPVIVLAAFIVVGCCWFCCCCVLVF